MTILGFSWNFPGLVAKIERPLLMRPSGVGERDGYLKLDGDAGVIHSPDNLLFRFADIHRRGLPELIEYASRFGVPLVSENGLPADRTLLPWAVPVVGLLRFSERLDAALEIISALRAKRRASSRLWEKLIGPDPGAFIDVDGGMESIGRQVLSGLLIGDPMNSVLGTRVSTNFRIDLRHQRLAMEGVLSALLHWGRVTPSVKWEPQAGAAAVVLTPAYLSHVGALAVQLAWAATDTNWLEVRCSECHMVYTPARQPNPKRRNYCPRCRAAGAPQRAAARAYRERRGAVDGTTGKG